MNTLSHSHPPHHPLPSPEAACPSCRHEGPFRRHAVRASWWRDVPTAGRPQVRRGHIVRWRCTACLQTHSCQPDWALPGKRLTRELEGWIRQALQRGQTIRAVARLCGVDEKTVRAWAQMARAH
ncbi:MAG: helix-turn-helix domain-containing protein [Aquabacterium sp.]